jgi:hypothetical protein
MSENGRGQSILVQRSAGKVILRLKTPWRDGTTHVLHDPVDFEAKLAALVPRPQKNLVLCHGVLAAHAAWRKRVVAYRRRGQDRLRRGVHVLQPRLQAVPCAPPAQALTGPRCRASLGSMRRRAGREHANLFVLTLLSCACVLPEVTATAPAQPVESSPPAVTSAPAGAGSHEPPASAEPSAPERSCAADNGGCDTSPHAICSESAGQDIRCACPAGYQGDGMGEDGCVDLDECAHDNGGCDTSPLAKCENRIGAPPLCTCPADAPGSGVGADGCKQPQMSEMPLLPCAVLRCDAGTVYDPASYVTWQRVVPSSYQECSGSPGTVCSFAQAKSYCEDLMLFGRGWRVPTVEEYRTILDINRPPPMIDEVAFPDTPAVAFWSLSGMSGRTSPDALVDFGTGKVQQAGSDSVARVRCVR